MEKFLSSNGRSTDVYVTIRSESESNWKVDRGPVGETSTGSESDDDDHNFLFSMLPAGCIPIQLWCSVLSLMSFLRIALDRWHFFLSNELLPLKRRKRSAESSLKGSRVSARSTGVQFTLSFTSPISIVIRPSDRPHFNIPKARQIHPFSICRFYLFLIIYCIYNNIYNR